MHNILRKVLDWRAVLLYTHRWLGIVGGLLFIAWFASGIVMMYARMPALAPEEQLARLEPLDLSTATITPAEAVRAGGGRGTNVQVSMLGRRPVYRVGGRGGRGGTLVYADTGERFAGLSEAAARDAARRYEPGYTGPLRQEDRMTEPDQWTLQARAQMPMRRFALDDPAATRLYVSDVTGDVVLRTTRQERLWAYLGPVTHWVYFTPLRRNGPLWSEVVIWSSVAGCVMCIAGLVWGLLRFSASGRFRLRGAASRSPYVGWMKWHHYTGLIFGLVTLTWTYSGLLSMGPFGWFEPAPTPRGRRPPAVAAGDLDGVSLARLREAHAALSRAVPAARLKQLELIQVRGRLFWAAERAPDAADADRWRGPSLLPRASRPRLDRRYVAASAPDEGTFDRFPRELMMQVAADQMSGVPIEDSTWLDAYDRYYYDSRGSLPLPVLRVRYADEARTWIYVDPSRGAVVERSQSITRLQRWLYQGLHSLDFPFLYYRRPLWDVTVIVLSLGGLALGLTSITDAWRRLKGHAMRLTRVGRARRAAASELGDVADRLAGESNAGP